MKKNTAVNLKAAVSHLNGVGSKTEIQLKKLGINSIQDMLFHLPLRYLDRTRLSPIGALTSGQEYMVQGEIELCQVKFGRRRSLLCQISDGTGALVLRFFYFNKAQQERLQQGNTLRCYGQVRSGAHRFEMIHPEYQHINPDAIVPVDETLTPVYPTTEGLHQIKFRKFTDQALGLFKKLDRETIELLPDSILKKNNLPDLYSALIYVHRPPPDASVAELKTGKHPAQQRLAFEELLSQYLSLQQLRNKVRKHQANSLKVEGELANNFIKSLAFTLTGAQQTVAKEIRNDMDQEAPMLRLLQGDVGSGKTVVAALAALRAIEAGFQVAIMAPTELLSEQHFDNFTKWFSELGIKVVTLTGKLKKAEREQALEQISKETPLLVVGTHALFQDDVVYNKLGLVIIDEQHRFGVHQRLSLLEKGSHAGRYPHQLVMTATPIPRTLTMTAYADLDVSVIDELPPNRKPVNTVVLSNKKRDEVVDRIKAAGNEGRQIYWVCTLIEESESLQCETAVDTENYLKAALPKQTVALIHGRLKNAEKEMIMLDFKKGKIDLLVATTVIEVGVDVPNASLMIIENAERLGLAQLHQLRGRVGRGSEKSDCVLMYQGPLSDLAKKRLAAMRASNDGFKIAEQDLELRGPGELLGTRQAGLPELQVADMVRDANLFPNIQIAAEELNRSCPESILHLIRRWQGKGVYYGHV